jgi:hypothetical protein
VEEKESPSGRTGQHASFGGETARVQNNSKSHLRALAELYCNA